MSQPILHIADVNKSYGEKVVLDDVDLKVSEGEFCTLVGPSGCGKSTLLRLILGQETPTRGQITLRDKVLGLPDAHRGIVFQRYALFPHLSVLDNVLLGKRLTHGFWGFRRNRKVCIEQAMHYLERVRLADHADKYPHELSGGMQQRVSIAQSLITQPDVLLMDEPFGALDPNTREEMQMFLLELWESEQMTVFFITHDLEEAVFLGTRVLVLSYYYTDDRGNHDQVGRGARIVTDLHLPRAANATTVKHSADFVKIIEGMKRDGFDPAYLQHVDDFNLNHPDAFQTLSEEFSKNGS